MDKIKYLRDKINKTKEESITFVEKNRMKFINCLNKNTNFSAELIKEIIQNSNFIKNYDFNYEEEIMFEKYLNELSLLLKSKKEMYINFINTENNIDLDKIVEGMLISYVKNIEV